MHRLALRIGLDNRGADALLLAVLLLTLFLMSRIVQREAAIQSLKMTTLPSLTRLFAGKVTGMRISAVPTTDEESGPFILGEYPRTRAAKPMANASCWGSSLVPCLHQIYGAYRYLLAA